MYKTITKPDLLLGWMGSLSDPTRLRILRLLERHELGVVELCDVLQLPQSNVSRHLKVLADQGWVKNRRQGTTHLYRMILDELEPAGRKIWLVAREQTQEWATAHQDEIRLKRRLRERQCESKVFFAGTAGQWDKLRQELYGQRFTQVAMLALLSADYVVADLGCGTGAMAVELSPFVKRVIGVDSSVSMLRAARRRIGELTNVELHRADLEAIPLDDGACDVAMMTLVLTYVQRPDATLAETGRIIRPCGRAVIVDLLPHDRDDFRRQMGQQSMGFDAAELEHLMSAAGFDNVVVRPISLEPGAKGPGLFLATGVKK